MRIEYVREQAAVGLIAATVEDWMALDLFAGIPVTDYAGARRWYEQFFGRGPAFLPNDTEAGGQT